MQLTEDFDGIFKFTNATNEDFIAFWNNKEYTFPKGTCCPIIIPNETAENIQEIRKKWAYKIAVREFYKGSEYARLVKLGNKSAGGIPPIFDEKILEPLIEMCLKPLPIAKATVKEGKKSSLRTKGSRAVGDNDSLNEVFKDEPIRTLGKMAE